MIEDIYKYDLHVHTCESSRCGKATAPEIVEKYLEEGYRGVLITDHFKGAIFENKETTWDEKMDAFLKGYKATKEIGDKAGLDVFLGVELRLPTAEIVEISAVGITETILRRYENLNNYSLEQLYELANKEGFLLLQVHPFRTNNKVMPSNLLHGYEVINAASKEEVNNQAYTLCQKENLPFIAGSDFHSVDKMRKCGIYTKTPIESIKDLVDRVKSKSIGLFCDQPLQEDNKLFQNPDFLHIKK